MYSLENLLYSIQLDLYSHKLLQHCFYDLQHSLLIMKPCLDLRCKRQMLPDWLYSDTIQIHACHSNFELLVNREPLQITIYFGLLL